VIFWLARSNRPYYTEEKAPAKGEKTEIVFSKRFQKALSKKTYDKTLCFSFVFRKRLHSLKP
jgi:hypothetical protein